MIHQSEPKTEEHHDRLRQLDRYLTGAMSTRRVAPAPAATSGPRMPAMPAWWTDDDDASESSLAATRQM
jgi:hypothetical protein